MNVKKIGNFIKTMRKAQKLTQKDLADNLHVSFQAVSRWENGDALPDTSLLLDLAKNLGVSVDMLLNAGGFVSHPKGKFNVAKVPEGFAAIEKVKECFGERSLFYIGMIEGINRKMNMDFLESMEKYPKLLYTEVLCQAMHDGYEIDKEEVEALFKDNYKTYNLIKSYDNEYWHNTYEECLK